MILASESKKNAENNKAHASELAQLSNHLEQLIKVASNKGLFELKEKPTFPQDRFKQSTVDEVLEVLKTSGYKVALTKNNAMQQIVFSITW